MSFKYSKGAQVIGDLKAQDDTQRDTQIDFGEDYIGLETSGTLRMKISGSDGSITFNEAFTFPISDGSANQVLKTNGSGQLSWTNQSSGGSSGVRIPYPRLYFSGISPVSQIGNNSFTSATISTDNGKYENGFIDFGSSGNTAPARFESEIPATWWYLHIFLLVLFEKNRLRLGLYSSKRIRGITSKYTGLPPSD